MHACASAEQAQPWLHAGFAGVIVTDVRLPGRSGLEVLSQVVAFDPDLPVIVVTGHGDVSMAVEAMRGGAYDFIEKPFAAGRLMETTRRAQEKRSLVLENRRLKAAWAAHPDMPALIGQSAATERVRTMIRSVVMRPTASESQPDKMRPPAFPQAPMRRAVAAATPALRANGTSWLMVIWPAVVPRQ